MKGTRERCLSIFLTIATILVALVAANGQSIPLGQPINTSSSDEYNPCISGNGRTLIFEQLYFNENKPLAQISYQKGGTWTRPEPLPGANTDIPTIVNGGFFLNQNGNTILFHSARYGGLGASDIWIMEKTIIGTWAAPKNLGKPINSPLQETDASLSPDGKFLYFTRLISEKTPDGTPCGKIFVAERSGKDSWKTPIMLPAPINVHCECGGKMLSDNKTFIFSSMREGGQGGYDIYKTVLHTDGSWEDPVPYTFLNTTKDDKSVSVPAGGGLIYHTAPAKTGGLDIVRTKIPDELQPAKVILLQGLVKNGTTNLALIPKVIVTNVNTGKAFYYTGAPDGSYTVPILQEDTFDVAIQAAEGSFTFKSLLFKPAKVSKYEEKTVDVKLIPNKPDVIIPLNNMAFVNNSDTMDVYSVVELNRIYSLLRANITMRIEIGVHTTSVEQDTTFRLGLTGKIIDTLGTYTDSTGRELYRLKTTYTSDNTTEQAKAITKALIKKGIPVERVIPKGYSDKIPLMPAPIDKALNRRIELKIIHE